jgi:hypothetical protein
MAKLALSLALLVLMSLSCEAQSTTCTTTYSRCCRQNGRPTKVRTGLQPARRRATLFDHDHGLLAWSLPEQKRIVTLCHSRKAIDLALSGWATSGVFRMQDQRPKQ